MTVTEGNVAEGNRDRVERRLEPGTCLERGGACAGIQAISGRRALLRGVPMGALGAFVIGVPTDVVANSLFTRMTPVHWWSYVFLALSAGLTALCFALPPGRKSARLPGATVLAILAVGCPVCNKIAVAVLGASGAVAVLGPMQPVLAALSIFLAVTALRVRATPLRMRPARLASRR